MVVRPKRCRDLLRWTTYDGLDFGDKWTDGYEAVGRRWLTGIRWRETQTIQSAEERVRTFLTTRPDLR